MRSLKFSCAVSSAWLTAGRNISFPPGPFKKRQDKSTLEEREKEATEKGFARRETLDDIDLLLKNTPSPEKLPESGVQVLNLPKDTETTPFDSYKRSTVDFSSRVTPHGIVGVGLGAGFGSLPDKRLGFLRPRNSLQPRGIKEPKYDENGMPIEDSSLSDTELIKKRKEYLQSFSGTTMSHREHFLLVDLDFEKDSILFGDTREEFERNVAIMKKVILAYQRWERTDNMYYYATFCLKLATIWVLIECAHEYAELQLLASNYDTFTEAINEEIYRLDDKRRNDVREAREELKLHPPQFTATLQAMLAEKQRLVAAKAATEEKEAAPRSKLTSSGMQTESITEGERPRGTIPVDEFYAKYGQRHPLDTTDDLRLAKKAKKEEVEAEMRRLSQTVGARERERAWQRHLASVRKFLFPLWWKSALTKEDFAYYSYAASPTSIEAIKKLRRKVLPKSEDYTQIVRDEMIAYENKKRELELAV